MGHSFSPTTIPLPGAAHTAAMAASEDQIKKENKQSTKVLEELMGKLSVSQPGDEAKGFSQEIATFINGDIEEHAAPTVAVEKLRSMLNNKKDANANQAGEEEEEKFDAMGNKIESTKKKVKLSSAELRKKKKDRMARRKRGEEVFSDEED